MEPATTSGYEPGGIPPAHQAARADPAARADMAAGAAAGVVSPASPVVRWKPVADADLLGVLADIIFSTVPAAEPVSPVDGNDRPAFHMSDQEAASR
jgi:hypothetical protein